MRPEPVKTAVVGCGMISEIYMQNMARFSILDLVACADLDSAAAERRAAQFGIAAVTVEEILADPAIELVINLTGPTAHYEVVRQLLEAGKHVYTEKIMTLQYSQAKDLVELARDRGLVLASAPDTFLGAALQTARWALDAGLIGEPVGCTAVLARDNRVGAEVIPYLARPGGGIAYDVGIYYLTALAGLLGPVRRVSGFLHTRNAEREHRFPRLDNFAQPYRMDCENQCAGALLYESGAVGTVLFTGESVMNDYPSLTIYGSQGILFLPDPDAFGGPVYVVRRGNSERSVLQQNHGYSDNSRGLGAAETAWSIRLGREPRASGEMACHCIEVLEGIAASGERGAYTLESTFVRPAPLPQGHLAMSQFADFPADEEAALCLPYEVN